MVRVGGAARAGTAGIKSKRPKNTASNLKFFMYPFPPFTAFTVVVVLDNYYYCLGSCVYSPSSKVLQDADGQQACLNRPPFLVLDKLWQKNP
jgi:hypothetical protein